jgi:hypothetical protein
MDSSAFHLETIFYGFLGDFDIVTGVLLVIGIAFWAALTRKEQ